MIHVFFRDFFKKKHFWIPLCLSFFSLSFILMRDRACEILKFLRNILDTKHYFQATKKKEKKRNSAKKFTKKNYDSLLWNSSSWSRKRLYRLTPNIMASCGQLFCFQRFYFVHKFFCWSPFSFSLSYNNKKAGSEYCQA